MYKFDNPLDGQFAHEAALSFAIAGRKLRAALDRLESFDVKSSQEVGRDELVEIAGEALWCYIVHRETLGLVDADYIVKEYGVPSEVRRAMGPRQQKTAKLGDAGNWQKSMQEPRSLHCQSKFFA